MYQDNWPNMNSVQKAKKKNKPLISWYSEILHALLWEMSSSVNT